MVEFGKRNGVQALKPETEETMNVSDRIVMSPKFPKYMTIGLIGGVVLTMMSGVFKNGLPGFGSVLSIIVPMAFLVVVIYFSFRGIQKQHARDRAVQQRLAKYPQLYFWGFAGGAMAYALYSGTSLTTLLADAKASFEPITINGTGGGHYENTFMDMGHWILGGVLLAYVTTFVLDKLKERENAR